MPLIVWRGGGEAAALPPLLPPLFSRETPVISTEGRDPEIYQGIAGQARNDNVTQPAMTMCNL